MRVALNGYFWSQPNTGSGQYLRHLWEALHEPDLMPQRPFSLSLLLPPDQSGKLNAPLPLRKVTSRIPHGDKLLWEWYGVVREAGRARADLLHLPYLAAPLASPVPTVVTAHDMIPWVVPGYGGSRAFALYLRMAVAGVRRARLIMADSEASRRDTIRILRVPPSRVHTVYLGIEPPQSYTPEELEEARVRYGLPAQYAFYIGGFDRRKNVPLLLGAWREALDALTLVGEEEEGAALALGGKIPQPGGIFPDVRGEAAALGFPEEGGPVRFLGFVPEEDKPRLMAGARLFIYPSAYEGFGLDPLEAMSLGTPVVSSWGGSLREVVGDGGLLVPPDDEAALARAVKWAWHNTALREDLAARGRAHAEPFTWERTARQTARLYLRAARGGRRGRRA
jgi:glycosyltransferase involved in cell wall biosynthesis